MAGFLYRKSLITKDDPTLLTYIIDNSDTITIGDAVRLNTDGHVTLAGAGNTVLGVVVGVVDANGISIAPDSGTTDTWTVDSDNETVDKALAQVIVSPFALFSNDADDDMATTNLGQFYDILAASNQIDESEASDTSGQFQLISLDPDGDGDASKGLFRIAESQLFPYAQQ